HTRSYGDWSSDVCSSDLAVLEFLGHRHVAVAEELQYGQRVVGGPVQADVARHRGDPAQFQPGVPAGERDRERVVDARIAVEEDQIGRASCRGRRGGWVWG